jgi:hypothetical protein
LTIYLQRADGHYEMRSVTQLRQNPEGEWVEVTESIALEAGDVVITQEQYEAAMAAAHQEMLDRVTGG